MNQLTTRISSEIKTMTLKEITDLLDVRHDKAMLILVWLRKFRSQ